MNAVLTSNSPIYLYAVVMLTPQSQGGRFVKRPYTQIERPILVLRIMTKKVCGHIVKRGLRSAGFRALCLGVPHTARLLARAFAAEGDPRAR